MEFHQIRYFLAACDHLNFTRAAEACHVSQPALSVAVKKLEEELGGQLFLRGPFGLELTDLGRTMRQHLGRVDETRRLAERAASEMRSRGRAEVHLGVYSTIGPRSICGAVGAFQATAPEVALTIYDVWGPRASQMLLSGAFDCAVMARHAPLPPRLEAIRLYTEPMVLAVAADHPLAEGVVRVADLAGLTYFDRLRCEYRVEIQAELARRGIALDATLRSEPEDWVQSAVAAGRGVTILPRDQIVMPGLVARTIADLPLERVIELVTVAGRPLDVATRRFTDYLSGIDWQATAC